MQYPVISKSTGFIYAVFSSRKLAQEYIVKSNRSDLFAKEFDV